MNIQFDGKTEELIFIEDGFTFPSMSKVVQYNESSHSSRRRRRRSIREPFSFSIPLIVKNNSNKLSRDEVNERLISFLYSDGPKKLKVNDGDWHFIGEFSGPYLLPNKINIFTSIEVQFTSEYSYKVKDKTKVQSGNTITIDSKTQLPTMPKIELTGLTGTDIQISNSKKDGTLKKIRLTGTLPSALTVDIEKETIFTTSTGTERLDLLRAYPTFEDFTIENGDVVTINQSGANAKITYKELML